jgi:phospholipid/cholesterol/gamma-HCH transport system substrate-binding protein
METRAGYIAVGSAVLLLFIGALGFVLWMAKYDGDAEYKRYWVYFTGSVTGLKTGSTVSYRGISVGEVVDLRIDPENVEQVRATIEVLGTTPVKTSTVASLEMQGLTGGSMILLSGGSETDPPLARDENDDYPVIASTPSQLERLFEGAPALVEQVDLLVRQATLLLNSENRQAVATILQNMSAASRDLAATTPALQDLVANTNAAITRLDRIATAAEPDIKETLAATANTMRSADTVLGEAEKTVAAFGETAGTFNAMLEENRRPLKDFTHVTLYDMNAFIAELRELTVSMRRVANELGRDPAGFIFGNQQKGYEAR